MKDRGARAWLSRFVLVRLVMVALMLAVGVAPFLAGGCVLRKKHPDQTASKDGKRK